MCYSRASTAYVTCACVKSNSLITTKPTKLFFTRLALALLANFYTGLVLLKTTITTFKVTQGHWFQWFNTTYITGC